MDSVSTPVSIPSIGPIQVFLASPTILIIVSIPKSKAVLSEVEPKKPLKLLITGKEIDEDIELDSEIEIPKLDFNIATVDEMRLVS